jgi:putative oxidoreductase
MSTSNSTIIERIPALRPVYAALHDSAETVMRVLCGAIFAVHGYPKIMNPFGATEMVAKLGFAPAAFWSFALSATEFTAGILLAIGFLTRPAAFAASVILAVTVYAHWIAFGQGYAGSEKSILWLGMAMFFAVRGANKHSVDAKIGKQF